MWVGLWGVSPEQLVKRSHRIKVLRRVRCGVKVGERLVRVASLLMSSTLLYEWLSITPSPRLVSGAGVGAIVGGGEMLQ